MSSHRTRVNHPTLGGIVRRHITSKELSEELDISAARARDIRRGRIGRRNAPIALNLLAERGVTLTDEEARAIMVDAATADLVAQLDRMTEVQG